jgi:hypothetical protein
MRSPSPRSKGSSTRWSTRHVELSLSRGDAGPTGSTPPNRPPSHRVRPERRSHLNRRRSHLKLLRLDLSKGRAWTNISFVLGEDHPWVAALNAADRRDPFSAATKAPFIGRPPALHSRPAGPHPLPPCTVRPNALACAPTFIRARVTRRRLAAGNGHEDPSSAGSREWGQR